MWDGERGSFDYIGVSKQRLIDFGWRNLLSSALNDVLDSAHNEEITVAVEISEVAGSEPAIPKRCIL